MQLVGEKCLISLCLIRPLAETKTLDSWDIKCTVNGGGSTG